MRPNESRVDRLVRITIGLALLGLAVTDSHASWGYIGIVPLFTGLIGYCPLYALFGFSTCPMTKE